MDKFAQVQRRMTRSIESETNDVKLNGLGCLLWRKEEQGQNCEVLWPWQL